MQEARVGFLDTAEHIRNETVDPMSGTDPDNNLSSDEIEDLERLEGVVQHGLSTHVRKALAEIRDRQLYRATNRAFEDYLAQRWGVEVHGRDLPSQSAAAAGLPSTSTGAQPQHPPMRCKPCEDLAELCEQTVSALRGDDPIDVEIRVAVRKQRDSAGLVTRPPSLVKVVDDELVPRLRWLLTQAGGTIADVVQQLEANAADIDDGDRAGLREDLLVIDDELTRVEALLVQPVDWDSSFTRLLQGEIPPLQVDDDSDRAEDD